MKKKFKPPAFTTVIGSGTVINGGLTFAGGMHLDGKVFGDVIADGESKNSTLTVSDQAKVVGNVRVANIIVNGSIEGDIHSSSLVELAENAHVSGAIHYRQLEMAMGATVDGGMVRIAEGGGENAPTGSESGQEDDQGKAVDESETGKESGKGRISSERIK